MADFDHFFSCDWGTSSFRLRLVRWPDCRVLQETKSDDGAARLSLGLRARGQAETRACRFAGFLNKLMRALTQRPDADLDRAPVIISGMASSAMGWLELPYADLPFAVDGGDVVHAELASQCTDAGDHRIFLVSGVRTDQDVMRGEEVQVVGLFQAVDCRPYADDAMVLIPGTHSKHIRVRHGAMTGFSTYMTGEMFELMRRHSILNASVTRAAGDPSPPPTPEAGDQAFRAGVRCSADDRLTRCLFRVRTNELFDVYTPEENDRFLSGALLGAEVADLAGHAPQCPILLCADAPLQSLYRDAFETLGLADRLATLPRISADLAAVRGHGVILSRLLARTIH